MLEILNPDLTPLQDLPIDPFEAGQDSAVISFALRNSGVLDVFDVLLVLQVQDPATGLWVSSGAPPADELWARLRLTGQDATNAPAQPLEVSDWIAIGAWRGLRIQSLFAGGIRFGELKMRPPATAASLTWRFHLAAVADEHSHPVPPGVRPGILTGLGDPGHSALLRGFEVTPAAPPSDQVHVAAGHLIHRGRLLGHVAATVALDQLDAAGEPLAAGESYLALLTAGPAGVTVTKGLRAAVPVRPSAPPWEPVLAVLEVLYQASSISEIEPTHIADLRLFDRYYAEPGAGLQLRIHPGRAIAGGTLRYHSAPTDLSLPPNATTWLWQRANGSWELAAPTDPPPETTALGPLWIAVTDAETVIDLQDRRAFASDTVVLHLRGDLPAAPGPIAEALVVHDGLILEDVLYRLSGSGGGSAGQTRLDLLLDGATLYPSFALDDQRPAWPYDAAGLIHQGRIHEVAELHPGQLLQLASIEHPTGGAPTWAEAYLVCRRS